MLRDPRDIVVSHYHKFLADPGSPLLEAASGYCEHPVTHENIRINLPGYIRFLFEGKLSIAMRLDRHIRRARALELYTVRYEQMLDGGEDALAGIVYHLTGRTADRRRICQVLEETRFEKLTGRKRGEENTRAAVARKGIAGDWKNQFTLEAARVFDHYAGDLLIESGYEADHCWVGRVSERPGDETGSSVSGVRKSQWTVLTGGSSQEQERRGDRRALPPVDSCGLHAPRARGARPR